MKPFRAISVDDEPRAHDVLSSLIADVSDVVLETCCTSPLEALQILRAEPHDLLFLDVSMPAMNGLDFLRSLEAPPVTILLTAHAEYAITAFELGVRDYLLKPLSATRLEQCLNNVRPLLTAARNDASGTVPARLSVKIGTQHQLIDPRQVSAINADGNFSVICVDGERIFASESMKELEHRLTPFGFVRVHKSHLVNAMSIVSASTHEVCLEDGTRVPVGRAYKEAVAAALADITR